MNFPEIQCSKSETWNDYIKPQAAILNCQIENDVLLFNFKLAWATLRSAIQIINEHRLNMLLSVILVIFFYILYKSYWSPVLYVKELTDVGFDHIPKGPGREVRIAREMRARKVGVKLPPPYPNGWFALAESSDLKIGGVTTVSALGQNLCVYRGEDGVARCVDAYCPHLGANLGVGGRVEGGCIECPFHRWRFGGDGACVNVPGLETAPRGVSIKTWPVVEADGAIWMWHDAEGRKPLWTLQDAEELKTWGYRGRNEFVVGSHIMDIPENGADVAHLNAVHSTSLLSGLAEKYPLLLNFIGQHSWSADWSRGEGHEARMELHHHYKIGKLEVFKMEVTANQDPTKAYYTSTATALTSVLGARPRTAVLGRAPSGQLLLMMPRREARHVSSVFSGLVSCTCMIGPGHVRLYLSTVFGPALVSQSVTPLSPLRQRVVHRLYSPWRNAPPAAALVHAEGKMFERDMAIWNNKRYVSSPAYAKTDKSIRAFRAWFSQFYSEHSVSFKDATQNRLDW